MIADRVLEGRRQIQCTSHYRVLTPKPARCEARSKLWPQLCGRWFDQRLEEAERFSRALAVVGAGDFVRRDCFSPAVFCSGSEAAILAPRFSSEALSALIRSMTCALRASGAASVISCPSTFRFAASITRSR